MAETDLVVELAREWLVHTGIGPNHEVAQMARWIVRNAPIVEAAKALKECEPSWGEDDPDMWGQIADVCEAVIESEAVRASSERTP